MCLDEKVVNGSALDHWRRAGGGGDRTLDPSRRHDPHDRTPQRPRPHCPPTSTRHAHNLCDVRCAVHIAQHTQPREIPGNEMRQLRRIHARAPRDVLEQRRVSGTNADQVAPAARVRPDHHATRVQQSDRATTIARRQLRAVSPDDDDPVVPHCDKPRHSIRQPRAEAPAVLKVQLADRKMPARFGCDRGEVRREDMDIRIAPPRHFKRQIEQPMRNATQPPTTQLHLSRRGEHEHGSPRGKLRLRPTIHTLHQTHPT